MSALPPQTDKRLVPGLSTRLFRVSIADMEEGLHGVIETSRLPFDITLNRSDVKPRQELALVHELLHLASNWLKIPLGHEQLHVLAAFVLTEVIPAHSRFREAIGAAAHKP